MCVCVNMWNFGKGSQGAISSSPRSSSLFSFQLGRRLFWRMYFCYLESIYTLTYGRERKVVEMACASGSVGFRVKTRLEWWRIVKRSSIVFSFLLKLRHCTRDLDFSPYAAPLVIIIIVWKRQRGCYTGLLLKCEKIVEVYFTYL